jgi:hypothetical protein
MVGEEALDFRVPLDVRLIAERTFRRLDAPELLADVANGVVYVNGVRQRAEEQRVAA